MTEASRNFAFARFSFFVWRRPQFSKTLPKHQIEPGTAPSAGIHHNSDIVTNKTSDNGRQQQPKLTTTSAVELYEYPYVCYYCTMILSLQQK